MATAEPKLRLVEIDGEKVKVARKTFELDEDDLALLKIATRAIEHLGFGISDVARAESQAFGWALRIALGKVERSQEIKSAILAALFDQVLPD